MSDVSGSFSQQASPLVPTPTADTSDILALSPSHPTLQSFLSDPSNLHTLIQNFQLKEPLETYACDADTVEAQCNRLPFHSVETLLSDNNPKLHSLFIANPTLVLECLTPLEDDTVGGGEKGKRSVAIGYAIQCLDKLFSMYPNTIRGFACVDPPSIERWMSALVQQLHHSLVKDFLLEIMGAMPGGMTTESASNPAATTSGSNSSTPVVQQTTTSENGGDTCGAGFNASLSSLLNSVGGGPDAFAFTETWERDKKFSKRLLERVSASSCVDAEEQVSCLTFLTELVTRYDCASTHGIRIQLYENLEQLWDAVTHKSHDFSVTFPAACAFLMAASEAAATARDLADNAEFITLLLPAIPHVLDDIKALLSHPFELPKESPLLLPDRSIRSRLSAAHVAAVDLLTAFGTLYIPEFDALLRKYEEVITKHLFRLGLAFPLHSIFHRSLSTLLSTYLTNHRKTSDHLFELLTEPRDHSSHNVISYLVQAYRGQSGIHYHTTVLYIESMRTDDLNGNSAWKARIRAIVEEQPLEWGVVQMRATPQAVDGDRKLWVRPLQDDVKAVGMGPG
eukprot:PhF_6_TR24810/c0_g1_i4/m.34148